MLQIAKGCNSGRVLVGAFQKGDVILDVQDQDRFN
jgi:hypothetical protein